jgi:uncharacterized membrane protein YgcG
MFKSFASILAVLFSFTFAWAGSPPPEQMPTQLNLHARRMVAMGVQPEQALKLQHHFQEREMAQIKQIIQSAEQLGVPVKPIVDKALEGIAKKVSADNIVRAMAHVRTRYAAAQEEAGHLAPEPALRQTMTRTLFQAMTAGLTVENMSAIAANIRNRQQEMAQDERAELAQNTFVAARDMVRLGAEPEQVKEILSLALQKRYDPLQMKMLGDKFRHQSLGNDPGAVTGYFLNCLQDGKKIDWQGPDNYRQARSQSQIPGGYDQGSSSKSGASGGNAPAGGNGRRSGGPGGGSD